MSFKDLSKIDAPNTVKSGGKLQIKPSAKSTDETPTESTPAPKQS